MCAARCRWRAPRARIPATASSSSFSTTRPSSTTSTRSWGKVIEGMENVDKIKRGEPVQLPRQDHQGVDGGVVGSIGRRDAVQMPQVESRAAQWCATAQRHCWTEFGRPEHADCSLKFTAPGGCRTAGCVGCGRHARVLRTKRASSSGSMTGACGRRASGCTSSTGFGRRMAGRASSSICPATSLVMANSKTAVSFVTLAVLFLWDCHVVTPHRSKFVFFLPRRMGAARGVDMSARRADRHALGLTKRCREHIQIESNTYLNRQFSEAR